MRIRNSRPWSPENKEKLKKLGEHYGIEHLYSNDDYEKLLASGLIDAVYLANTNDQHESYTLLAAKHGIHVLCEKPMAMTEASCQRMLEACEKTKAKFMVAYRLHFHPAFLRAIEIARSGDIGDVRLFDSLFVEPIPDKDSRLQKKNGVGPLDYIGIYCINSARALFGAEPVSGQAFASDDGSEKFSEVPEMVSAVLEFPHGRMASFTCGFNSEYRANFRVVGTKGDVFVDRAYAMKGAMTLTLTQKGKSKQEVFEANDQFGAEIFYFSNCILKDLLPQPSAREGLADVRWLRGLEDSIQKSQPTRLTEVAPEKRPTPAQALNFAPIAPPLLVGITEPF